MTLDELRRHLDALDRRLLQTIAERQATSREIARVKRATDAAALRFGTPPPTASDDVAPDPGIAIPRPPHWGGYHLWVQAAELWVEGAARLHDRARWTCTLEPEGGGFRAGRWSATRLQP